MRQEIFKKPGRNLLILFVFLLFMVFLAISPLLAGKMISAQVAEINNTGSSAEDDALLSEQILKINDEIQEKKENIEKLQNQSIEYKKIINQKRAQGNNLANQMAIINNRIAKMEIDIKTTKLEIDKTKLEIQNVAEKIKIREKKIEQRKKALAEYLLAIYKSDKIDYLQVLLLHDSFSEFFDQIQYLENIQSGLRQALLEVISLKDELQKEKIALQSKERELENLKNELENQKQSSEEEITVKEILLSETKNSEREFQRLLAELKKEQQRVDNEIASLEKTIRKKLEESDSDFQPGDKVVLSWPIPFRGITATFHDPDYPFRYIFEHPAVDLRASQGTPIKTPASGYVGRVKDGGFGYSYIMLIHSGGISTVYGHVSKISVQEDSYVTRGQIIGYTGGAPGTPGAGRLTTGPHLHFEVRLEGIPVNPLDYLIDI